MNNSMEMRFSTTGVPPRVCRHGIEHNLVSTLGPANRLLISGAGSEFGSLDTFQIIRPKTNELNE